MEQELKQKLVFYLLGAAAAESARLSTNCY